MSLAAGLKNAKTRSTPAKRERADLPDSLDDYIKYKMKKETAENEISIERAGIDAERAQKETELSERRLKLDELKVYMELCKQGLGHLMPEYLRKGIEDLEDLEGQ